MFTSLRHLSHDTESYLGSHRVPESPLVQALSRTLDCSDGCRLSPNESGMGMERTAF